VSEPDPRKQPAGSDDDGQGPHPVQIALDRRDNGGAGAATADI
jgi:hypothetical protein